MEPQCHRRLNREFMDQIELQDQVLSLLENFKGIDPLKTLFWSKLNYDRVNKSTSRRGWPDRFRAAGR